MCGKSTALKRVTANPPCVDLSRCLRSPQLFFGDNRVFQSAGLRLLRLPLHFTLDFRARHSTASARARRVENQSEAVKATTETEVDAGERMSEEGECEESG